VITCNNHLWRLVVFNRPIVRLCLRGQYIIPLHFYQWILWTILTISCGLWSVDWWPFSVCSVSYFRQFMYVAVVSQYFRRTFYCHSQMRRDSRACLSVCLSCSDSNFECLDLETSYLVLRCIFRISRSEYSVKVTRA